MMRDKSLLVLMCVVLLAVTIHAIPRKGSSTGSSSSSKSTPSSCMWGEAFHEPTKTCYQTGKQGPCNVYERWYAASENATEGHCSCLSLSAERTCGHKVNQPIARSVKDQRCYPVYSKANCQGPNEWFTFQPNSIATGHCTPNPCGDLINGTTREMNETSIIQILGHYDNQNKKPSSYVNLELLPVKPFWFLHRGKCVKTFTLGTCGPQGGNHTLIFTGTKPIPRCVDTGNRREYSCLSPFVVGVPTRQNVCPRGHIKVGRDCVFSVRLSGSNNPDYE